MEKHIKERLVGAIVLVAIVVIVVPELLTGPRERTPAAPPTEVAAPVRTVTIDLQTGAQRDAIAADRIGRTAGVNTPSQARDSQSAPGVLPRGGVDRAPEPAVAGDRGSVPASAAASVADEAGAPELAASAAAKPEPTARVADAPKSGTSAAPLPEPETASSVKPHDAKIASPASTATTSARKAAASAAAPPRPTAPSTSAAEGWVVQLGSFASRPNAERLASELRAKGYAGFVSEFRGSGRVLYRVRVGPEQDRGRADAIAQRLARDGRKGSVTPHP